MKREKKAIIPDLKEFTDESGKKWVPTSADDLFSMEELNNIIKDIEKERANTSKSQLKIKNEIILLNNESDKKIHKVLKKDQDVIYEAKKDDYKYNPGLMEKMKDFYKDTKENIKEKLGGN